MTGQFSKLLVAGAMAVAALVITACGSAPAESTAGEGGDFAAQAVIEATPTAQPTLRTEIIEAPVSPVSPLPTPEPTMPTAQSTPAPGSEQAVAAAIADLSSQIGAPADQISLVSVEAQDWPDAALGCPQEGFMYAQVITPGYLIILEAQGQQYEYHTNSSGDSVILCNQ